MVTDFMKQIINYWMILKKTWIEKYMILINQINIVNIS